MSGVPDHRCVHVESSTRQSGPSAMWTVLRSLNAKVGPGWNVVGVGMETGMANARQEAGPAARARASRAADAESCRSNSHPSFGDASRTAPADVPARGRHGLIVSYRQDFAHAKAADSRS